MSDDTVYVTSIIPAAIAKKMDAHIVEKFVRSRKTPRKDNEAPRIPTRSSYIRDAILHYLECGEQTT